MEKGSMNGTLESEKEIRGTRSHPSSSRSSILASLHPLQTLTKQANYLHSIYCETVKGLNPGVISKVG